MSKGVGGSITKNFMWRLMERLGAQGISFIVSIILARLLSPEVYGVIALVLVFTTILQVFVDSGLGNALIQKKTADDTDFSSVFYFNVAFGLALYGIMFLIAPLIAAFYQNAELTDIIRVLSLTVVISSIKNVQQAYVARNMMFKRFFWSTIGGTVVAACVGIAMAYKGYGVWALVALNLTNLLIDTAVLWITVQWRPRLLFSWERLKGLLSFGWKLLVGRLVETVYSELHSLIIGKRYTSEALAHYNRGKQYPNIVVTNIDYSITSVLFPVMSSVQEDKEKCQSIVRRAIITNIYLIAPLMMGLAVCAEPIVRLMLTDKWLPCIPYLRVFCFTMTFLTFNTANMNTYRSLGRSDIYLKVEMIRKAVGLIVLAATMWFGVMWIAYGEILVTLISMAITAAPNKKMIGYGFLDQMQDVIVILLLTLVMGGCVYLVGCIPVSDGVLLLIQVITGVAVYIIGSWMLKLDAFHYLANMLFARKKNV